MQKFLYITALMSVSLACGMTAPNTLVADRDTIITAEMSTEVNSVEMVVVADEGLNIRVCPGVNCLEVDEDLKPGEVVICDKFQAPMDGDGLWCHHERGWSNVRWMVAK